MRVIPPITWVGGNNIMAINRYRLVMSDGNRSSIRSSVSFYSDWVIVFTHVSLYMDGGIALALRYQI